MTKYNTEDLIMFKDNELAQVKNLTRLTPIERRQAVKDLTAFSKKFLKHMDFKLTIPIVIEPRLKRAMGSFHSRDDESLCIKISENQLALSIHYNHIEMILATLKHELIHYVLFEQGKGFKDGQADFEQALAKYGATASWATPESKIKTSKGSCFTIFDVYQGINMKDDTDIIEIALTHTKNLQHGYVTKKRGNYTLGKRIGTKISYVSAK